MARVLLNNHIELHERRIALILVPKVATSSIRHAVRESCVRADFGLARAAVNPAYRSIGIVRNTWDRLLSCWHQKTSPAWPWKAAQLRDKRLVTGMKFEAFLDVICEDTRANHHFYPQDEVVGECDEIWKLRGLDMRWHALLPEMPLSHDNVNPTRERDWSVYYTTEMHDQVLSAYRAEVERFEFEFEA